LAEYRSHFEELAALGFGVAALSVDPPARSRALAEQLALPFPLLCDQARDVVRAYGVYNEAEKGGIAYPATFVLDPDRVVRFRSLDRTASRVDLAALLAYLRQGLAAPAPPPPVRRGIVPTFADWARVTKNALRHGVRSPRR
jgi:peroxiredoxin